MEKPSLAIIGVGLIGGSFAKALRVARVVERIVGYDSNNQSLEHAKQLGVIDEAVSIEQAAQSDIVVVAVPVRALPSVFSAIAPHLRDAALLMDVGSTKRDALAAASCLGSKAAQFVPAHPIAGRETSGIASSDAMLFNDRFTILTPSEHSAVTAIDRATRVWNAAGAKVVQMTAAEHDEVFAAVSHLPHMLAFALVTEFAERENANELFRFAASGFRDFTRIAASSPEMWRDIALNNRTALLEQMRLYRAALDRWIDCVDRSDSETLAQWMSVSREWRERWGRGEFN
jgi:prephenate dehydrogenase